MFSTLLKKQNGFILGGVSFLALSSSLSAAGYILPNGTILYDDSPDHTMYRVERMTAVQSAPATQVYAPVQTTSVIVEDRVVTYDRPVVVRERVIDRGPVYDIVDATGAVIMYGLLYDAALHSFYHYGPHTGPRYHFDHYRR